MTPDERNLLGRFLQDLAQARGGAKDADAAQMIDQAVRTNPDAGYLLVQHALLADQALHTAQDRIAELERAGQGRPMTGGSFLGGAWGGSPQPAAQPQGYAPQGYGAAPGYGAPQPAPVQAGGLGGLFGGGGAPARTGAFGSFLRQAGTTAAGVAGGEMLFSGLSNLFGGHRGGGFGYGGGPETVIVNDYGGGGYGPDGGQGGFDGGYDDGGVDDGGYDDGGVS